MSADRPRKASAPAFPKKGPRLRLVKSPDERPFPEPVPELKAMIKDMNRRHRERIERDPDSKDAA